MTGMYFYRYHIEYYVKEDSRIRKAEGLTFGLSYVDAVARLLNYYGEDEVISFSLHAWDDWNCIEMPHAMLDELENYDSYEEYLAATPSTDPKPESTPAENIIDKDGSSITPVGIKAPDDSVILDEIRRYTWRAYSWTQQKDYHGTSKIVNAYRGATIDEIKASHWYRSMVETYGENDIIFEEV